MEQPTILYGKGKGKTGEEIRKEREPKVSAKAKTKATVLGCAVRSLLTSWMDATQTPKPRDGTLWDCQGNEWRHTGMLGKVSKVKPTKDWCEWPEEELQRVVVR